jgi:Eukaryotic translation initiation factor eIF2A
VQLKWAAGGGGLLAETSSDSDSSNRSYYGETKLHFLSVRRSSLYPVLQCASSQGFYLGRHCEMQSNGSVSTAELPASSEADIPVLTHCNWQPHTKLLQHVGCPLGHTDPRW